MISIHFIATALWVLLVTSIIVLFAQGFGKATISDINNSIKLGSYWDDLMTALDQEFGRSTMRYVKISLIVVFIMALMVNLIKTLLIISSIAIGARIGRKLFTVGIINNVVNKLVTYINRFR